MAESRPPYRAPMPESCESCEGEIEPGSGWHLCPTCLRTLGVFPHVAGEGDAADEDLPGPSGEAPPNGAEAGPGV